MDEMRLEQELRETLNRCAKTLEAPAGLKDRIDQAAAGQARAPKRRRWRTAAAVLAAVLLVTGAVGAAGGLGMISGHSWNNERMTLAEAREELPRGGELPEAFANGYAYENAVHTYEEATGVSGKSLGTWVTVDATYRRGGSAVTLSVSNQGPEDYFEEAGPGPDETREVNGVEMKYDTSVYKAVPMGYVLTEAEETALAEGDLQLGYGAAEITEQTWQALYWEQDGVRYTLSGFDLDLTAEDLFAMAGELLGA